MIVCAGLASCRDKDTNLSKLFIPDWHVSPSQVDYGTLEGIGFELDQCMGDR
jgi:hypothetical protein